MEQRTPDLEALTRVAALIARRFGQHVPDAVLKQKVEGLLFRDKDIWGCFTDGLISSAELRDRFLAEMESWLRDDFELGWDTEQGWLTPEFEVAVDIAMRPT